MVTVVDAQAWLRDYASTASLRAIGQVAGEEDGRMLVDLLVEQVEFADVIVLNKADLVSEAELGRLAGLISTFNPRAEIVASVNGKVPLSHVLGTGRFDFAQASQAAGWAQALSGHHLPESCQGSPDFPQPWSFRFPHPVEKSCRRVSGRARP
jgi:G3E family GTPase